MLVYLLTDSLQNQRHLSCVLKISITRASIFSAPLNCKITYTVHMNNDKTTKGYRLPVFGVNSQNKANITALSTRQHLFKKDNCILIAHKLCSPQKTPCQNFFGRLSKLLGFGQNTYAFLPFSWYSCLPLLQPADPRWVCTPWRLVLHTKTLFKINLAFLRFSNCDSCASKIAPQMRPFISRKTARALFSKTFLLKKCYRVFLSIITKDDYQSRLLDQNSCLRRTWLHCTLRQHTHMSNNSFCPPFHSL